MKLKRNTLTTAVLAGLTGIAGLASVARADTLEDLTVPTSFSYDGNNCVTLYRNNQEAELCWEEEQSEPLITYELSNGCVWEYHGPTDKKTICPYDLENLRLPEH